MAASANSLASSKPLVTSLLRPVPSGHPGRRSTRSISMAFQPIVDLESQSVVAYEALARGDRNEPASSVLSVDHPAEQSHIDRSCRLTAIGIACALGLLDTRADLCINVNPRGPSSHIADLSGTIAAAQDAGLPLSRLILEVNEGQRLRDPHDMQRSLRPYRDLGLRIAIDDFGAGYAGLTLLTEFPADILKLDIGLIRGIADRPTSRTVVSAIAHLCRDLGIELIAEGVEQASQVDVLRDLGIRYMQGHFFAAPAFESLPLWP